MTPIQQAKATYDNDSENTFEGDLVWHLHNAYVYPVEDCNTWFVWLGSGKAALKRFLEVAPFRMEYVAWHRHGSQLKIYKWKDYERKVNKYGNNN